jgi:hypothetical protein
MSPRFSNAGQKTIALPASDIDLIRFERNLLSIGYFSSKDVSRRKDKAGPETRRKITQWVDRDKKRIKVSAEFRCELGLPTSKDRDKYMAFMMIVMEHKRKLGLVQNPIEFSAYRLLKILGQTQSGANYEEVYKWSQRMQGTAIESSQIIYSATRKQFLNDTVNVFSRVTRRGDSDHDGNNQNADFRIDLSSWILENINQSWVVPEDFAAYQKLSRPIAKGIFVQLNLWFYACRTKPFEKDYEELCALLSITCQKVPSKIKENLGPALNELISIGYLAKWDIKRMVSKPGYKIIFYAGPELLRILPLNQLKVAADSGPQKYLLGDGSTSSDASGLTGEQERVKAELISRGVLEDKASKLCASFPLEIVEDKMDYFDSVLSSDTSNRLKNPAGLLITLIEGKNSIPPTFETKSERLAREQRYREANRKKQTESENWARNEFAQMAYSAWRAQQAQKVINEQFPGTELEDQLVVVKKGISPSLRASIDRMPKPQRRECLLQQLTIEIAAELNLLSFDEWCKANPQAALF